MHTNEREFTTRLFDEYISAISAYSCSLVVNSSANSQDFIGARCVSAVNSLMIKRALAIALGFLAFCFPLTAQQTSRVERTKDKAATPPQLRPSALGNPARLILSQPEFLSAMHGSAVTDDLMMLTLSVGQRLPASSELGWMGMPPLDYFQDAAEVEKSNAAPVDGKDSPSEMVSSPLSPIYYSGEIGVFYGRSSGKFDREIMQTYFLGQIGNDKFQITVGGAYGESNVNAPRYRSFKGSK